MPEILLMIRGVWALIFPPANVQGLVEADMQDELKTNTYFKPTDEYRSDYTALVYKRLAALRRDTITTFLVLASAVLIAWMFASYLGAISDGTRRILAGTSIFLFAWGTLARLSRPNQSMGGVTAVERLDAQTLRGFYWLGTLLGSLSLV